MDVRRIGSNLAIDGYIYKRTSVKKNRGKNRTYWRCVRYTSGEPPFKCDAKAITLDYDISPSNTMKVFKGPAESPHNHTPSLEEMLRAQLSVRKPQRKYTCTSQSTGIRDDTHQSSRQDRPVTEKERADELMTNPDTYRKFLSKFAEKPVFDRNHIMEALKSVFKTDKGRIYAYAVVLENREKFAQDFEAFQGSPEVTLHTLEECHSTTSGQENSYFNPEVILNENNSEIANIPFERLEELRRRESQLQEILTPAERQGTIGTNSGEPEAQAIIGESGYIPPVPAAIPINQFHASVLSSTADVIDLSDDEVKVKKEIELVDLTDDIEVKQECSKRNIDTERMLQSNGRNGPAVPVDHILSSHQIPSNDMDSTEPIHLNLSHNVPNSNVFEPQCSLLAASSAHLQPEMPLNVTEKDWLPYLDQLYDSLRSHLNESILASNSQVPLMRDNLSTNSGGDVEAGHISTQYEFTKDLEPNLNVNPSVGLKTSFD